MDLVLFIRIFLGTVMITTSILKMLSFNSFKLTIKQLNIIFVNTSVTVSLVIFIEMLSGLLMFFHSLYIASSLMIILLSICFIFVAIRSNKLPGKVTCNCFGNLLPETLGSHTIYRAIFLILLSILTGILASTPGYQQNRNATAFPIALSILQSLALIGLYGNLKLLFSKSEHRE
ncbi:MauE/DoxX family redox-associated membrane protein [Cohnella laeviribosi]|uniref:MauE/DoxX family redox-associated membrane protein n=1 Tax=Cohnella laeviribosi TaxID=380174 RepID=UPI003D207292